MNKSTLTPAHRRLIELVARRAYENMKQRREQAEQDVSKVAPAPPRRVG